jgi:uncharacterized membrane-anchored protein
VADMTGWTPVTAADGKVLGWMAPADVETPWERSQRARLVEVRADRLAEMVELLGSAAFDVGETFAAARAAGLSAAEQDSAGHMAVVLAEIEEPGQ